jgi:hypothetical protein
MPNLAPFVLTTLAAIMLAGCFTSKTSLNEGVTPLRPLS